MDWARRYEESVQRSGWSFSGGTGTFSPSADGGRGKASIIVSSNENSDSDGTVKRFAEKETFFFMRRMEGEVDET